MYVKEATQYVREHALDQKHSKSPGGLRKTFQLISLSYTQIDRGTTI